MRWITYLAVLFLAACASSPAPERFPTRAVATPTVTTLHITAQDYYEQGLTRCASGDAEGAMQFFNWALQIAPDFAPAYLARGGLYLAQGDLRPALADAASALQADPENGAAYALRGEVLRLQGRAGAALEAFDRALDLAPALAAETFRSRWLAARATRDPLRLSELSREYASAYPQDPLRYYYRGWALIRLGTPSAAIRSLSAGIESTSEPPALLWFALGQAYAANRSWDEAITSYEAARTLVQAGDASLTVHSDLPVVTLFGALGEAYLGAGRCVDAEVMLEYALDIGAAETEYGTMLEEARICQTPTPTVTPYPTTTPSMPGGN